MSPYDSQVCILAALARNGVIGKDGRMPWRLPGDLRRFKNLTLGHPVVMGRKTYDSIVTSLGGPLPGRENIVVSRSSEFTASGCTIADSLDKALALAKRAHGAEQVFVIGGAQIYGLALRLAGRMHLTEIDADFDGDVYFPPFSREQWRECAREPGPADALHYSFVSYERRPSTSGG